MKQLGLLALCVVGIIVSVSAAPLTGPMITPGVGQRSAGDPLNVRSLGAKGDGVHDDTVAFERGLTNNGVVYVPPGTYLITRTLRGDGVEINGANAYTTFLLAGTTNPVLLLTNKPSTVRDITITGGSGAYRYNSTHFVLDGVNQCLLENCVSYYATNALDLRFAFHNALRDVRVSYCAGTGIQVGRTGRVAAANQITFTKIMAALTNDAAMVGISTVGTGNEITGGEIEYAGVAVKNHGGNNKYKNIWVEKVVSHSFTNLTDDLVELDIKDVTRTLSKGAVVDNVVSPYGGIGPHMDIDAPRWSYKDAKFIYLFDSTNSTIKDWSGNGMNGTLSGASGYSWQSGPYYNSLILTQANNTPTVLIPTNSFDLTRPWTALICFNSYSMVDGVGHPLLYAKDGLNRTAISLMYQDYPAAHLYYRGASGPQGYRSYNTMRHGNRWSWMAFTFDPTNNLATCLDPTSGETETFSFTNYISIPKELYIGQQLTTDAWTVGFAFAGVWQRTMTRGEVMRFINEFRPASPQVVDVASAIGVTSKTNITVAGSLTAGTLAGNGAGVTGVYGSSIVGGAAGGQVPANAVVTNATLSDGAVIVQNADGTRKADSSLVVSNGNVGIGSLPIDGYKLRADSAFIDGILDVGLIRDRNGTAYKLDMASTDVSGLFAGKVGIGTTNPTARLEVNGGTTNGVKITDGWLSVGGPQTNTSSITATEFIGSGAGVTGVYASNLVGGTIGGQIPFGSFTTNLTTNAGAVFVQNADGTRKADSSLVVSNGNVGVGAVPATGNKLDVAGIINMRTGDTLRWANGNADIGEVGYNTIFRTWTGAALTEKLRIQGNGNVGIGTTNPAARLEVNGGVKITDGWLSVTGEQTNSGSIRAASFIGSSALLNATPGDYSSNPTLSFGDGDTGFYESSDDSLVIGTAGAARFLVSASGFRSASSSGPSLVPSVVSVTNPTVIPSRADAGVGVGYLGTNTLTLIAGWVNMLNVGSAGSTNNGPITATEFIGSGAQLTGLPGATGISTNSGSGTNNTFTAPTLVNPTNSGTVSFANGASIVQTNASNLMLMGGQLGIGISSGGYSLRTLNSIWSQETIGGVHISLNGNRLRTPGEGFFSFANSLGNGLTRIIGGTNDIAGSNAPALNTSLGERPSWMASAQNGTNLCDFKLTSGGYLQYTNVGASNPPAATALSATIFPGTNSWGNAQLYLQDGSGRTSRLGPPYNVTNYTYNSAITVDAGYDVRAAVTDALTGDMTVTLTNLPNHPDTARGWGGD